MPTAAYPRTRILVTGATGLIGSALVAALLAREAEVHVFTLPEIEPESALLRGGLLARTVRHTGRLEDGKTVRDAVAAARPEVVFHLGAQALVGVARADPVHTFAANVAGTWSVLESCRAVGGVRAICVASSDKAYGGSDRLPYREDDPIGGVAEPYEASKAMADIVARSFAATYGLPVRVVRCGNVYGPGDWNWSRIVPGTIRSLLRGEPPVIRSDGTPLRDYVHVEDAADAYLRLGLADIAPGEAFNISSGERRTVLDVVRLLAAAVGSDAEPKILGGAKDEIPAQALDATKARERLGWSATKTLDSSLPETLEWYRELLG